MKRRIVAAVTLTMGIVIFLAWVIKIITFGISEEEDDEIHGV